MKNLTSQLLLLGICLAVFTLTENEAFAKLGRFQDDVQVDADELEDLIDKLSEEIAWGGGGGPGGPPETQARNAASRLRKILRKSVAQPGDAGGGRGGGARGGGARGGGARGGGARGGGLRRKALDPAVVEVLKKGLESDNWILRSNLLVVMQQIDTPETKSMFITMAKDPNKDVRGVALGGLMLAVTNRRVTGGEDMTTLLAALADPDLEIRIGVVNGLYVANSFDSLNKKRIVKALIELVDDESREIRKSVAATLGRIDTTIGMREAGGRREGFEALKKLLRDEDPSVHLKAVDAFKNFDDLRSTSVLIDTLQNYTPMLEQRHADSSRSNIVFALGKLKDVRAVTPIIRELESAEASRSVRSEAVWALGQIQDRRAVPSLLNALKDDVQYVQGRAAIALGMIGDHHAVNPILILLDEERLPDAATALGEFNDPAVIDPLVEALFSFEKERFSNNGSALQMAAAKALEKINNPDVVTQLVNAVKAHQQRGYAESAALRIVGMKTHNSFQIPGKKKIGEQIDLMEWWEAHHHEFSVDD